MGGKAMTTTVYHGGTERVDKPLCLLGRKNLDFGQGFYITDIKERAVRWAVVTAQRRKTHSLINIYQLDRDAILAEARCKIFQSYDREWLDFIVASRRGENPAALFDYVEGGVANDRVIDTVNLYMFGLLNVEMTLQRLAYHRPNNQICLLNQSITHKYLTYESTEPIE